MVMIAPFWYQIVNVLTHVWIWSEFITMLFNKSVVLFMISWRGDSDPTAGDLTCRWEATRPLSLIVTRLHGSDEGLR